MEHIRKSKAEKLKDTADQSIGTESVDDHDLEDLAPKKEIDKLNDFDE